MPRHFLHPLRSRPTAPTRSRAHRPARRANLARTLLGLALVVGCEEVVVEPIAVSTLSVLPAEAQLFVGQTLQFTAQLQGESGESVSGRDVDWRSDAPSVAAVDGRGLVTGLRPGTARITATVEGVSGSAVVTVALTPGIALSQQSVTFSAPEGVQDPPAVQVEVTNAGAGPLEDLTASTEYEGAATGWLDAVLAGTATPTTLTLRAHAEGLPSGVYSATVSVTASGTAQAAATLVVVFQVQQNAPAPPSDLRLTDLALGLVALAWNDNSDDETGFEVERQEPGAPAFALLAALAADQTSYRDETVGGDGEYGYRIRACSDAGCSLYSNVVGAITPPNPPADVVAEAAGNTAIDLTWVDNSVTESAFRIERRDGAGETDFVEIAVVDAGVTSYSDTGLQPGSAYAYRLRACSDAGCSDYSVVATAVTGDPPTAPTGLSATVISPQQVELTWTDNSDDETGFTIDRAVGGGAFSTLATVAANASAHTDRSTSEDGTYRYRVRACADDVCSAPSNTASALTPPAAPSGLTVSPLSASSILLEWTDNSTTEARFRIERRIDGDFTGVGETGPDATRYEDGGLEVATAYEYRVLACSSSGCSGPSNSATGSTADVAPAAPTGLSVVNAGEAQIDIVWTDNADNESEFQVERATGGGDFSLLASTGPDRESYSDGAVSIDTEYRYRVRACNGDGCSPPSATVAAVTPPLPPTGTAASPVSNTRIDVTWSDNSATESAFRVDRRVAGGSFAQVAITGPSVTLFSDQGLEPNTTYEYRVRACNDAGCTAYDTVATASTLETPPPAAPTGLTATLAGDGASVALAWTDQANDESEFRIQRSVNDGTFDLRATVAADVTAFTDSDIAIDTEYAYRVEACSDAGCSAFSNEAAVVTAPVAPSGLTASLDPSGAILLTWTDNASTEQELRIERSEDGGAFAPLATLGTDAVAYKDESAGADAVFGYRVRACNATGCSPFSGEATQVTLPTPAADLAANPTSSTAIGLTWSDNSGTETGFRIERRTGGSFAVVAEVGADVTAHTDGGLSPVSTYEYRVVACNPAGCAQPSNVASASTQQIPAPAAPSGLSAAVAGANQIDLAWTDNASNEEDFEIQRQAAGGSFEFLGTVGADVEVYSDLTVVANTAYAYRVRACNVGGCSAWSNEADAATLPTPASGLSATFVSGRVDLAWTDNSDTETGFRIERKSDGAYSVLSTVAPNVTTYSDQNAAVDTRYTYRVLSCNEEGCATPSNEATATTLPRPAANLSVSAVSNSELALSWVDNSVTETNFEVQRRSAGSTFTTVATPVTNAESYRDRGLDAATEYEYQVRACNGSGCSAYTDIARATTSDVAPGAPSALAASTASASQIDLTWSDNSSNEAEFRIERRVGGGEFTLVHTASAGAEAWSDTGVSADTEYAYRVRACNPDACSAYSNVASAVTPPVAPSSLAATTASSSRIDLDWTDNSATETSFRIEINDGGGWTAEGTAGADATTFVSDGLTPSTAYEFRVQACNGGGCSGYSNVDGATTKAVPPPAAPTSLTAGLSTDGSSVGLNWTDASTDETSFRVHRSVDGGGFSVHLTRPPDATSATDTDVSSNHRYAYRVEACNDAGCSDFSNEASVETRPAAPTGVTAVAASASAIDLSWSDNSGYEDGFEIQRAVDGGNLSPLTSVGAGVESYRDENLQAATTYGYQVRACNDAGCSAWSATASATTADVAPAAPSGLSASTVSSSAIDLAWSDNSGNEDGFEIQRREAGGSFAEIATPGPGVESFSDTGLDPNTAYEYRVRACNDAGCSGWSATASATTDDVPPTAPTGLTASADSDSEIEISWTDNSDNEDQFRINRTGGGSSAQITVGQNTESYEDDDLDPSTTYAYEVRACNQAGCSAAAEASATTEESPPDDVTIPGG